MNKAFEKILERLEESQEIYDDIAFVEMNENGHTLDSEYARGEKDSMDEAMEIVQEVAEEYKGGWIPCTERLPEECVPVNVTWINRNPEPYYAKIKDVPFSATAVYCNSKWYWCSSTCVDYLSEYGKNDFDLVDKDIDVVAWQPLPEPYKESED